MLGSVPAHTHTHTHTGKGLLAFWRGKIPLFLIMFFGGVFLTMNSCVQESDVNPASQKTKTTKTIDLRDGDSTDITTRNPCLPPSEDNHAFLREEFFDELIDLPGYCIVKVSYEVYTVWDGFEFFYQLDNVSILGAGGGDDCEAWINQTYSQCLLDCTPSGPPPPGCIEDCVAQKVEEFQVAIRDYILDKYVLEHADIRICGNIHELIVKAIFTRITCVSYCLSAENEGISIFNKNTVNCGTGCCIYQSTYCWDPITGDPRINRLAVETEISCGEQNTLNECQMKYGLNYHSPCREQICIER